MPSTEQEWREYFSKEGKTFFQKLLMFHRRVFISRAVRYWFDRNFPASGIFVEAGAGTSESSARITPRERRLTALDICKYVLDHHNVLPHKVVGDIRKMPFATASQDGIWNLGVMEHFNDGDLHLILSEFHRVLKPQGKVLLFWPPWFAPYELVLNSISYLAKVLLRRNIAFFPDEINRYDSRERIRKILEKAGFTLESTHFNWRDIFSYVVVVGGISDPEDRQRRL